MERMSAAFANMSVKRGDQSARVAHPELRKDFVPTGSETNVSPFDIKDKVDHVLDEASSKKVKLTSSGNAKKTKDVTKRSGAKVPRVHKVRGYAYDMSGHVHASVERYLELSKAGFNAMLGRSHARSKR